MGGNNREFGELEIQIAHMIGFMEAKDELDRCSDWEDIFDVIIEIGQRWYGENGYEEPAGYIDVMEFARDVMIEKFGTNNKED